MRFTKFSILLFFFTWDKILLSKAIILPNFYPFGPNEGDQIVPRGDDSSSENLSISTPIAFFGKSYTSLFVSTTLLELAFVTQLKKFCFNDMNGSCMLLVKIYV